MITNKIHLLNKRYVWFLLFANIVLCCWMIFDGYTIKNLNYKVKALRHQKEILNEGFFHSFDYKLLDFSVNNLSVCNHKGENIKINSTYINNTVSLFLNANSCRSCIKTLITMIKTFAIENNISYCVFVGGINKKEFKVFNNSYGISRHSFLLLDKANDLFVLNPFVFAVAEKKGFEFFYAPNISFKYLTEKYFSKLLPILRIR